MRQFDLQLDLIKQYLITLRNVFDLRSDSSSEEDISKRIESLQKQIKNLDQIKQNAQDEENKNKVAMELNKLINIFAVFKSVSLNLKVIKSLPASARRSTLITQSIEQLTKIDPQNELLRFDVFRQQLAIHLASTSSVNDVHAQQQSSSGLIELKELQEKVQEPDEIADLLKKAKTNTPLRKRITELLCRFNDDAEGETVLYLMAQFAPEQLGDLLELGKEDADVKNAIVTALQIQTIEGRNPAHFIASNNPKLFLSFLQLAAPAERRIILAAKNANRRNETPESIFITNATEEDKVEFNELLRERSAIISVSAEPAQPRQSDTQQIARKEDIVSQQVSSPIQSPTDFLSAGSASTLNLKKLYKIVQDPQQLSALLNSAKNDAELRKKIANLLTETNSNGATILHLIAEHSPDKLDILIELGKNDVEIQYAIMRALPIQTSEKKNNPAHIIASKNAGQFVAILQLVLPVIDKETLTQILLATNNQDDDPEGIFKQNATQEDLAAYAKFLSDFAQSKKQRSEPISQTNTSSGNTFSADSLKSESFGWSKLHTIAANKPEELKQILERAKSDATLRKTLAELLPKQVSDKNAKVPVWRKDKYMEDDYEKAKEQVSYTIVDYKEKVPDDGWTLLHIIAQCNSAQLEKLIVLGKEFPEIKNAIVEALQIKAADGSYPIHEVAHFAPHQLMPILELLDENQTKEILSQKDKHGRTLLAIIGRFGPDKLSELVSQNQNGTTLLNVIMISQNSSELLQKIVRLGNNNKYPETKPTAVKASVLSELKLLLTELDQRVHLYTDRENSKSRFNYHNGFFNVKMNKLKKEIATKEKAFVEELLKACVKIKTNPQEAWNDIIKIQKNIDQYIAELNPVEFKAATQSSFAKLHNQLISLKNQMIFLKPDNLHEQIDHFFHSRKP